LGRSEKRVKKREGCSFNHRRAEREYVILFKIWEKKKSGKSRGGKEKRNACAWFGGNEGCSKKKEREGESYKPFLGKEVRRTSRKSRGTNGIRIR